MSAAEAEALARESAKWCHCAESHLCFHPHFRGPLECPDHAECHP